MAEATVADDKAAADEETDAGEGEAQVEAQAKRKRLAGRTLVLFILLPAVLGLSVAGTTAFFFGLLDPLLGRHVEKSVAAKPTLFHDLPEMLVNLNAGGKQASYLKLRVALEFDDPTALARLQTLLPRIVDNFQVYLRELRPDELSGSAGLYRLKEELLIRVNTAVQPAKVNDVLFKEMLVQ